MKKRIIQALMAALFLLMAVEIGTKAQTIGMDPSKTIGLPESRQGEAWKSAKEDGYDYVVAENENFALYVSKEGNIGIKNKKNQFFYSSIPADRESDSKAKAINKMNLGSEFLFTFVNEEGVKGVKNTLNGAVNQGNVALEPVDNGVKIWYYIASYEVTIAVCYKLEEDGVRISIPFDDMIEHIDYGRNASDKDNCDYYGLAEISVLPFFTAAGLEDKGYIMIPDGSGALIYYNNGKSGYGEYSQDVYGRDQALALETVGEKTENIRMPVFGMKYKDNGYLAVITKGEACASINAMTSGTLTSYNNAYAKFTYRQVATSTKSVSNGYGNATSLGNILVSDVYPQEPSFEIKYFLLHKKNFNYMDMAQCYREYLIQEKGLKKKASVENTATCVNLLGGIKMKKYILGFPFSVTEPLTTYDEATEIIGELQEKNVNNLVLQYSGWQKGGIESSIPTKEKYDWALGGKKGIKRLKEYAGKTNTKLYPDVDLLNFYKSGNGFSVYQDSVQLLSMDVAFQYEYDLNTGNKKTDTRWRLLTPDQVTVAGNQLMDQMFFGDGISAGSLGSTVYADYGSAKNRKHREDSKNEFAQLTSDLQGKFGSVMLEQGNMYSAIYADYIDNSPMESSHYDIADESIPFYQAVLHGYATYFTEPVNLTADSNLTVLKALETGSGLSYTLMEETPYKLKDTRYNYLYNAVADEWIDTIAANHNKVDFVMNSISNQEMISHKKIEKNVYETKYANGVCIQVDYNKKAFLVKGMDGAPKGYIYLEDEMVQEG